MASRKEQLNAYSFARRRVVAAFLQPGATGTDEGAPRPLHALLPGLVLGGVLLAGFGAWGLLRPSAPTGWDAPGKHVIVADESTTRYVVLNEAGTRRPVLHPVLNMASARLLLDPGGYDVIKVRESVLDHSGIERGAALGIPYAPDRLPAPADAAEAKVWAVCDRPDGGTGRARQAAFVLGRDEAAAVSGPSALTGDQVLYVRDEQTRPYLVDSGGTKFPLGKVGKATRAAGRGDASLLVRTLFGENRQPQSVTDAWLATLPSGTPIDFPVVEGHGTPVRTGGVPTGHAAVGTVLRATSAAGDEYYVVTRHGAAPVTRFAALLLLQANSQTDPVRTSLPVGPQPAFLPADWPRGDPHQVNTVAGDSPREVVCVVLRGGHAAPSAPRLAMWAGREYPEPILEGTASAYVTPGSGMLYREVSGGDVSGGTCYLVTDTGLRYAVPRTDDSAAAGRAADARQPTGQAAARLGYADVNPLPIPIEWSELLPSGPVLDTASAARPQGA
ncbi:type VII secretion protein EccB [Streptomyces sp. NRRL F-5123]|uniref:type VII secretion protein EccB n=1 Tax=Streptomyces sp. NRRL F-5123 TaxID=1463856 RepID=UPI0004E16F43|nr:type VII secretion protein EccB [Streptomyces sp. NRRL F-5123]